MRNLRVLSLFLYVISLFVIPVCHITDISSAASDCSACSEATANHNQLSVSERCEPDHPCHNPNHTHHNHHSHDHNCSLCASIKDFANNLLPDIDNSVLDFSSLNAGQPTDEVIHNSCVLQSVDIRGPPVL
jgi:hypothetical protein